jgi:hypothetical protein
MTAERPDKVFLSYLALDIVEKEHVHGAQEFGLFSVDASRIEIRSGQGPREEANTLIHEVLHAICYAYGLRLPFEEEERIVNAVANGLCDFLARNPELVQYLTEGLKHEHPSRPRRVPKGRKRRV